jgi:hypothetical protein
LSLPRAPYSASPKEHVEDAVDASEAEPDVAKDLVEVHAAEDVFLRVSLSDSCVSEGIVLPAFLGVAQNRIGF